VKLSMSRLKASILLPLVLAMSTTVAQAECDKRLSIMASDYPPYVYRDKDGNWQGLDVELMRAIFKEADCSYVFAQLVAPKRMVDTVSSGKTDVMLSASDTLERRQRNVFGRPYRNEIIGLFGLAGKVDDLRAINDFNMLKASGATLLIPNAGWFGESYARILPSLREAGQTVEFTYFGQGARMLSAGRGRLIMSDTAALIHVARLEGVAVEQLPFLVSKAPVHMMFSKASVSAHDIAELDDATVRLEKKGVLAAIRSAYGLP
jgi:polar amino acid transport system substrate-binding protein